MKIGIDTNVLYYAVDRDSPFHDEARKALEGLVEKQMAVTTQQNMVELVAALTKRGASLKEALEIARRYREAIPVFRPISETLDIFFEKAGTMDLRGSKLFDVFLAATLLSNGVEFIYTYNEKDFQSIEGLKLWKPRNSNKQFMY